MILTLITVICLLSLLVEVLLFRFEVKVPNFATCILTYNCVVPNFLCLFTLSGVTQYPCIWCHWMSFCLFQSRWIFSSVNVRLIAIYNDRKLYVVHTRDTSCGGRSYQYQCVNDTLKSISWSIILG